MTSGCGCQVFRPGASFLRFPGGGGLHNDDLALVRRYQVRRLAGGARVTYPAPLSELPDGVFVARDGESWLVRDGGLRRWTPAGYTDRIDQFDGLAAVLTPRSTVAAIGAGYRPLRTRRPEP